MSFWCVLFFGGGPWGGGGVWFCGFGFVVGEGIGMGKVGYVVRGKGLKGMEGGTSRTEKKRGTDADDPGPPQARPSSSL